MENEIYKKIIGYEKLTNIFGYWPSFHDSEIISLIFERSGKDELEGPVLYVKIHVFQMGPETKNDGKSFVFHQHSIVIFRFAGVENLYLEEFNQQNAILGLEISEKYIEERKNNVFEITFEPAFGVHGSFDCDGIEIVNLEKGIPEYSVYKDT